MLESTQIVAVGSLRSRKLYRYISTLKGLRVEVLLIIDINDTHNLMTTAQGDLFDHLAHLTVAD